MGDTRQPRHKPTAVGSFLIPGLLGLLLAAPHALRGQGPAKSAPERPPAPSAGQGRRVEIGVEMRWRIEFRDNQDFRAADDADAFTGQRVRLHLKAWLHPDFLLFVQAQDVWLFGAASDKVIHDLATNLHQVYFDWRPGGAKGWELRAGRQEWIYGEERLLGAFGWDTVGRSFDGARLRWSPGAWSNDFLWGRQVDVRRNGARARAGHLDLSGAYFTRAPKGSPGRWEIYGLFLRDGLRMRGEVSLQPAASVRLFTLGFRRAHQPKIGWRGSVEHAWQFGERGPDGHRAAMVVATAGYAWGSRWQPRLQVEYAFGSGDDDPGDGRSREFNNLFPTNHPFYGYADLVGLRNLHDFRVTTAAALHRKLLVEADYHRFLLAAPRGAWKNAGGRVLGFDPTGRSGRDLGQEFDLTARLPLHKHVSVLAGYSAFLPGAFAIRTRGPETHHFGYLQTTVQF